VVAVKAGEEDVTITMFMEGARQHMQRRTAAFHRVTRGRKRALVAATPRQRQLYVICRQHPAGALYERHKPSQACLFTLLKRHKVCCCLARARMRSHRHKGFSLPPPFFFHEQARHIVCQRSRVTRATLARNAAT
jgi:hypothetical protein